VPVKDKKYKKVVVEGIVYIPVKKVPDSFKKPIPISSKVDTFHFGNNITYIPLESLPKAIRKIFYNPPP
jgi:hypothetical protein